MHFAFYFVVLFVSGATVQDATAKEEFHGGEIVSERDWYPNPFPVEVQQAKEMLEKTDDIRCRLITSFVRASLFIRRLEYGMKKEHETEAIRKFESCKDQICLNSAMMDKFMKPETFKEQELLLVKQVSIEEIEWKTLFEFLVDRKYTSVLRVDFMYIFLHSDEVIERRTLVNNIINTVCDREAPESALESITTVDVTAALLAILVNRYTSDVINDTVIDELLQEDLDDSHRIELWENLGKKMRSPGSNLATACLDPSLAYYDYERPSITKVREMAKALGVECDPVFLEFEFELDYAFAAPPSSNILPSGGAPGSAITGGGGPPRG